MRQRCFFDTNHRGMEIKEKLKVKNEKLKVYDLARTLRPEWVVGAAGEVNKRPEGMKNPKIKTGGIEIQAESLEIFSQAKTLPFPIDTPGYEINEEKRLKYRYLDLRRERMRKNLIWRQKVIQFMREFLILLFSVTLCLSG